MIRNIGDETFCYVLSWCQIVMLKFDTLFEKFNLESFLCCILLNVFECFVGFLSKWHLKLSSNSFNTCLGVYGVT